MPSRVPLSWEYGPMLRPSIVPASADGGPTSPARCPPGTPRPMLPPPQERRIPPPGDHVIVGTDQPRCMVAVSALPVRAEANRVLSQRALSVW
jgi:hypothetical protein